MKAYFISLFNFDRYANELIANATIEAVNTNKPVKLMAHLLAAQQVWLTRCKRELATGLALWPDWDPKILNNLIDSNHQQWINFLETLDDGDFEQIISYRSLKGEPFQNKLIDILAHVVNHGTHHRAQAGQHLISTGIQLPNTDYIFYLRTLPAENSTV